MRPRKCNEIPQMPKRDGKRSQTQTSTHYKVLCGTTILSYVIYVGLALLEPLERVSVQGQHSTLSIYADRTLVPQGPGIPKA